MSRNIIAGRPSLQHHHFPGGEYAGQVIDLHPHTEFRRVLQRGQNCFVIHADDATGPTAFDPSTLKTALDGAAYVLLWQSPCEINESFAETVAQEIAGCTEGGAAVIIAFRPETALGWAVFLQPGKQKIATRAIYPGIWGVADAPADH